MLVTINKHSAGTCVWCRKQTDDGVETKFQDGLSGFLCWTDFKKAVKARSEEEPKKATPKGIPAPKDGSND